VPALAAALMGCFQVADHAVERRCAYEASTNALTAAADPLSGPPAAPPTVAAFEDHSGRVAGGQQPLVRGSKLTE